MPFHHSAQNITVEDGHMLHAELCNVEGEYVEAEFDLNDCIGNDNGAFQWGGGGKCSRAVSRGSLHDANVFLPCRLRRLCRGDHL